MLVLCDQFLADPCRQDWVLQSRLALWKWKFEEMASFDLFGMATIKIPGLPSGVSAEPARGDVVTLRSPSDPTTTQIKRVVGLAGDRISTPRYKSAFVRIPDGKCWVESDHVEGGRDSNSYGAVPLGLITGKVTAIVWPKERVGWIENKVDEKRVLSTIRSA
eukprot:gene2324-8422_t